MYTEAVYWKQLVVTDLRMARATTTTSEEQDQAALVQLIKRLAAKEVEEEVEFILIGAG